MSVVDFVPESALTTGTFQPTRTGLNIVGSPSFEEWEAFGKTLEDIEGAIQWWRGDWLNYGDKAYGEKYAQAVEVTGKDYQTLANYAYVANRVTPSRRRENLSFTHHAEVASLEPREQVKYLTEAETKKLSVTALRKRISQERRTQEAEAALSQFKPDADDRFKFFAGDLADVLPSFEADSIDAIITDPPYPEEFLPVYFALAEQAARVLKPGGSLLVMCGQSYLPVIMAALCDHLNYQWVISYNTPGGQAPQIWPRKVISYFKPVLWFVKGEYTGSWVSDVVASDVNDNDKEHHHWGQSESGMAGLVERFTLPGNTVLDPFVGGGTTGVVCARLNRKFIGIDLEESNITISKARVLEAVAHV